MLSSPNKQKATQKRKEKREQDEYTAKDEYTANLEVIVLFKEQLERRNADCQRTWRTWCKEFDLV